MKALGCKVCGAQVRVHPDTKSVRCPRCTAHQTGDKGEAVALFKGLVLEKGLPTNGQRRKEFAFETSMCFARAGYGHVRCWQVENQMLDGLKGKPSKVSAMLLRAANDVLEDDDDGIQLGDAHIRA